MSMYVSNDTESITSCQNCLRREFDINSNTEYSFLLTVGFTCIFATNYVIFFNITKEILLKICDIYVSCSLIPPFNLGLCISMLDAQSKYFGNYTQCIFFNKFDNSGAVWHSS